MAASFALADSDPARAKRYLDRAARSLPNDPDVRRLAHQLETPVPEVAP